MTTPRITIGFLPRERFVLAAESLASLYEHTRIPFELVVVDPATPQRYLDRMQAVLDLHDNWRIIRRDRLLLPAESKNLVLAESDGDYVCLLENDNIFSDGWLEALVDACESFPADVAAPLIREGRGTQEHFDRHLGSVVPSRAHPGSWEIAPLDRPREAAQVTERVEFVEQHCVLFRRSVFDRIGPYDEALNTRDEVDLSLALRAAGATVVLEPRAVVNYVPPGSAPEPDELPFYRLRWDLERAVASRERIRQKWSLVDTPGDLEFVLYRNSIPRLPQVREKLRTLCDAGRSVVLIDDGDWYDTEVTAGLPVRPFPEVNGHFGGFPESEAKAVEELQKAVDAGATDIVVGWPARWWFDHLPALEDALTSGAGEVLTDDLLDIYVRAPGSTSSPAGT
jgi:GT2 family glycosyltransferase